MPPGPFVPFCWKLATPPPYSPVTPSSQLEDFANPTLAASTPQIIENTLSVKCSFQGQRSSFEGQIASFQAMEKIQTTWTLKEAWGRLEKNPRSEKSSSNSHDLVFYHILPATSLRISCHWKPAPKKESKWNDQKNSIWPSHYYSINSYRKWDPLGYLRLKQLRPIDRKGLSQVT